MKKIICIIVITASLFLILGCNSVSKQNHNTVLFYYIHNDFKYGTESGVITSTAVTVDAEYSDYEGLLNLYFNGPTNYESISPFPAGISLVNFQMDNNKVQLVLSPHMATLSDSEFTVACACLTRTVVEMTGIGTLHITIQGPQNKENNTWTFTLNDFTYFDTVSHEQVY